MVNGKIELQNISNVTKALSGGHKRLMEIKKFTFILKYSQKSVNSLGHLIGSKSERESTKKSHTLRESDVTA